MRVVGEGPLDIQGRDDEADRVHVYHGVLYKYGPHGDLPSMAPHIVGGIAGYTVGATRLRISIHMSLASVVALHMGLQLSGFAQSPFSYSG